MYNLTELVKQHVHFDFYRDATLWYKTDSGFRFGIPISDTGTGTFNATEKALILMRWIRPQLEFINNEITNK